ncbi:MAG: hypothetical protein JNJ73_08670 [Hyphomonadaceae bacterium]|nr:hypothetical protein [Hyphomonadaceae bacterium]
MARPNGWVCVAIAQALLLAVVACGGEKEKAEELTPQAKLAQALDPCANPQGAGAEGMCKDAKLAQAGGALSETLVEAASAISPPGADQLVQNQQRWLAAQKVECGMIDLEAAPTPEQATCLQAAMRERAQDATTAVQQVGGYTFQRMEITEATAVTAEAAAASGLGDDAPKAITRDIRFPRIDNAATPQAQRFNELVAQQPQFRLEDQTEEQVSYAIAFAGPELISVRFDTYDYTLGAAHPNNGVRAVTVVMTSGQPLAATDVFKAGSGWENFLTTRALRELTAQFRDAGFTPPRADVRDAVTKPHLWLVKAEGLTLLFPPYSFGGPHALGGAEVTVPWAELARFLNPQAPQPIRAPA